MILFPLKFLLSGRHEFCDLVSKNYFQFHLESAMFQDEKKKREAVFCIFPGYFILFLSLLYTFAVNKFVLSVGILEFRDLCSQSTAEELTDSHPCDSRVLPTVSSGFLHSPLVFYIKCNFKKI